MCSRSKCRCRAPAICYVFLSLISFLFTPSTACSNGNCQVLEPCSVAKDCGPGLYCGNCPALGLKQPICTRGQATLPTSVVNGLPFNKYSWIVTHNSISIVDAQPLPGVQRLTLYNQEDTVTNQLRNGVRGLMLDMYDFENDVWLCHSFRGQCFNFTAFQPAINTLKEVEAFLTENPNEIVTIIIEDYVHTPKGLTNLFTNAGLDKYWFPVSEMPKKREDWPTITEMVQANNRLLVFTSDASKEAEEGIAYQWKHMVENEPGDPGVQPGSCPNRKESKPLNSRSSSLFLLNYFPTYPVEADSCKENSGPLAEMVNTCYKAAGNVLPNFVAINFYLVFVQGCYLELISRTQQVLCQTHFIIVNEILCRSDGGGVFDIVEKMNGHTLCGCSTVTACQAGAPFGTCKNISLPTASPVTNTGGSFTGSVQFSRSSSPIHSPNFPLLHLFYFLLIKVFLQL